MTLVTPGLPIRRERRVNAETAHRNEPERRFCNTTREENL